MNGKNLYETDELLNQYLVFHYGQDSLQFPYSFGGSDGLDFPKRCALEGPDFSKLKGRERALDVGCSVGRSTFELAKNFGSVVGVDFSQAFIDAGKMLAEEGSMRTSLVGEGEEAKSITVQVDADINRTKVQFEQGDACDLRTDLGEFDLVIACNLICRLPDPEKFLRRASELVRPGGQLFLTTPFSWLESYTPRDNWLSNHPDGSFGGLMGLLSETFDLDRKWEMPFLIREHARKFQYTIAQASRWIRKT